MANTLSRMKVGMPRRFLAAIAVSVAFAAFLTADQTHWWLSRPDYGFGWLVPVFIAFLVSDRWPRLREMFNAGGQSPLPAWAQIGFSVAAGCGLVLGLTVFLFGAVYRAAIGVTQPGSFALAAGFAGILLGMIYFNVPSGSLSSANRASGWHALANDTRLRATGLFLFPATIWMLSAPLVSAVDNAVSLFLLQKVVSVVFSIFSVLGLPLVQEGNVLVLPHGSVGVAEACSGIRSLIACLFAGSFLAAVFLEGFLGKVLLVAAALVLAFFTNLLRSLFLTSWAYAYGSDAIEGTLHDATGFGVLGLTCLGLFAILPLFRSSNWRRWFAKFRAPQITDLPLK